MALLCVHRLALPEDILSTIKDFAFISVERKCIIEAHKQIHKVVLIHADIFDNDEFYNDIYHNRDWFFWSSKYQIKERGFNIHFCKICGDYLPRIYPRIYHGKPPICIC